MKINHEQLRSWLAEDIQYGDITTEALIDPQSQAKAIIVAKENGVVCGLSIMEDCLELLNASCSGEYFVQNGDPVKSKQVLAKFKSSHAALLKAERTFLNLAQHLSGIATKTNLYVKLIKHTKANILDTRKTKPGLRSLEKQAVLYGGGKNHRIGLYDQFLIKENHLHACRQADNPFAEAIQKARAYAADKFITIEVENLSEMRQAHIAKPNVILLDNMSTDELKQAVQWNQKQENQVLLEASGGIEDSTLVAIAETGVDRISIGAITHSAPAFDLSLLIE